MRFLIFTSLLAIAVFIGGLASQVIVPLLRGTPLFPMFRGRGEAELQAGIEQDHQALLEQHLAQERLKLREQSDPNGENQ